MQSQEHKTKYNIIHTPQISHLPTSCIQYKNCFDHDDDQEVQLTPLLGQKIA